MTERPPENVEAGRNCDIAETAIVGKRAGGDGVTRIGDDATIREGSIIYADVDIGDGFVTGHHAIVRAGSTIGDDALVGSQVTLDGDVELGSHVRLQTGAYLPAKTTVEDNVFFGPHAVVTNDPYPVREESELVGATIESHVSVGANATILPGVTVGENSFVAAGALVTEDVPPNSLVMGVPGTDQALPPVLEGGNRFE